MAASTQNLIFLDLKTASGAHEGAGKVTKVGSLDVKKMLEVYAFRHEITVPHATDSGTAKGRRQHGCVEFDVLHDTNTFPKLCDDACKNVTIDTATFHFHRTNLKGESEIYHKLTIKGGIITKIVVNQANVHDQKTALNEGGRVTISMSYNTIDWENPVTKNVGHDEWAIA